MVVQYVLDQIIELIALPSSFSKNNQYIHVTNTWWPSYSYYCNCIIAGGPAVIISCLHVCADEVMASSSLPPGGGIVNQNGSRRKIRLYKCEGWEHIHTFMLVGHHHVIITGRPLSSRNSSKREIRLYKCKGWNIHCLWTPPKLSTCSHWWVVASRSLSQLEDSPVIQLGLYKCEGWKHTSAGGWDA